MLAKFFSDPLSFLPLLLLLWPISKWILWILQRPTPISINLPPSPPRLPIIGNLHQMGVYPYRSLRALSERYGDLMLLHVGSTRTLVVSSADLASQVFKTHDKAFANRPKLIISQLIPDGKDVMLAPYGKYWRQLKSILTQELLNNKVVRSHRKAREEEVDLLMKNLPLLKVVDLSDIIKTLSKDLACRVDFGRKFRRVESGVDTTKLLDELIALLGGFYLGDFMPWLAWVNKVNGVGSRISWVSCSMDVVLERILYEHSQHVHKDNLDKDIVDILLEIQSQSPDENNLDRECIKALMLEILVARWEGNRAPLEWAMSELLKNPRTMQELQKEVRGIVGDKEMVTEDDLVDMKYLRAVLKETLRLHPPATLLFPHQCNEDVDFNGYNISAGTVLIVNAWSISRDARYWEDPEVFYPERFLDSTIDFKGQNFKFIPFGSGRRMCPGIGFMTACVEIVLANLVHKFNWSLPEGVDSESLDMTLSMGLVVHRRDPLLVVASPAKTKDCVRPGSIGV